MYHGGYGQVYKESSANGLQMSFEFLEFKPGKWIKVDEFPPPFGMDILVCGAFEDNLSPRVTMAWAEKINLEEDPDGKLSFYSNGREIAVVTHWMHLPKLPKEIK